MKTSDTAPCTRLGCSSCPIAAASMSWRPFGLNPPWELYSTNESCNVTKKVKKKIIQYKRQTSYLEKSCILQFSQRFIVQIQKRSCPMCVDGLTSTLHDVMVVKEAQYIHPEKVGPRFFFFDIIFSSSFLYPPRDNMCKFLFWALLLWAFFFSIPVTYKTNFMN